MDGSTRDGWNDGWMDRSGRRREARGEARRMRGGEEAGRLNADGTTRRRTTGMTDARERAHACVNERTNRR
jgi:hypothetical protein